MASRTVGITSLSISSGPNPASSDGTAESTRNLVDGHSRDSDPVQLLFWARLPGDTPLIAGAAPFAYDTV